MTRTNTTAKQKPTPTTTSPLYKLSISSLTLSNKEKKKKKHKEETAIANSSSPPPREVLQGPPHMSHQRNLLRHVGPPLHKQHSWSPDIYRDEAWLRRKGNIKNKRSKSVTDEDLDELKACIELGFGFDSPEVVDQRLSDTLPALELYYAVNKQYNDTVVSKSSALLPPSSATSDCETPSPLGSPHTILDLGDNPKTVKMRLRQWAQVVACSVKQSS